MAKAKKDSSATQPTPETSAAYPMTQRRRIIFGVSVFVLVVLAGCCFWFWQSRQQPQYPDMPFLSQVSEEQQIAVGQLLGDVYRNLYGYAEVCEKNNASLQAYPDEFKNVMADELLQLNQLLEKDNLTLDEAINIFVPEQTRAIFYQTIYNELKTIAAPDDTGITSACQLIDSQAAGLIQGMAAVAKPIYRQVIEPLLNH